MKHPMGSLGIALAKRWEKIRELYVLRRAMLEFDYRLVESSGGSMDSGVAVFSDGKNRIKVVKDRSDWMIDAPREELEPLGFWGAWSDTSEFRGILLGYAQRKKA
jgi:hypothetical protein